MQAERLFHRFYTVETARQSSGLGLSIAKLLTERMGGDISAEYRDSILSVSLRFPKKSARNARVKNLRFFRQAQKEASAHSGCFNLSKKSFLTSEVTPKS